MSMNAITTTLRAASCAIFTLVFASGCETSNVKMIGDPYFAKTKSKANVYARQSQAGVLKIAVMPFKASTELIGGSVSDMVVTELLRTQKYSLVERSQMNKVLSEAELSMSGISETKAVEMAKLMGAEAVVIGTVDEYGMQAKGGDTYAVVGLSIRLIDCSTAKILWSADLAKMAKDEDTPLAAHAREVVHELVAGLYQNLVGQVGDLPPAAPLGVEVGDMGLREAVVRWTKPQYDAKYRIERSPSESGPFAPVGDASAKAGFFRDSRGLKDGTTYYYRVRPVGRTGSVGDPSPAVETMTAPPPDPPVGLSALAPSSRCVTLTWSPPRSEGVTSYEIERAAAGEGWQKAGTASAANFKDGGFMGCAIKDSTSYRYRVYAVNRVGAKSLASAEAEVVTLPPPAPVAGFTAASRGIRCVPVSWKVANEKDVTGYELERADGTTGSFSPLATMKSRGETCFMDGKTEPGSLEDLHQYRYRIRSFNSVGGKSSWVEASATTKPKPSTPSGLAATDDLPGKSTISWKPNPETDIVEYRVESRSPGGWFWRAVYTGNATAADEKDLKPGETRSFRVMAVGPKGHESEWSAEVGGAARPLPPPPRSLTAVREGTGYLVRFAPRREGMTEFRVYRKKFVGMELLAKSAACEVTLPGTALQEDIDIVVTAIDEMGLESEPSEKLRLMK